MVADAGEADPDEADSGGGDADSGDDAHRGGHQSSPGTDEDRSEMDTDLESDVRQSDLVHERLRESPVKRWVLLDGNRYLLSGLLALVVFCVCAVIGLAGFVPVTDPGTATTLVAAIVGGTLPFITIVLAINQLVLSEEMGWTGELEERYERMTSFRREVEETTGTSVSPAAPSAFLQVIVAAVVRRAQQFDEEVHEAEGEPPALVGEFVEAITSEGAAVTEALEGAEFGTFDALSAVLGHFNGGHLHVARTLAADHEDELPAPALETLDVIVDLLGQVAVSRQTFKTLYTQHELAKLSLLLLYVGFPTLLGGGIFMMTYGSIIQAVGDPTLLVFVVSAVITLVFLPFIVLLVYTFRIASIASRTADFGPFVPRIEVDE